MRRLQTLVPELLKVRAAGEAPTDEEHPPDCQGASSREVICRVVEVEQGPDADAVEVRVEAQAAPHELEAKPLCAVKRTPSVSQSGSQAVRR